MSNLDGDPVAPFLRATARGLVIDLRVVPRSSRSAIAGRHGDRLRVRIKAPPVDGAANAEVLRLFAKLLGRARTELSLIRGAAGRDKTLLLGDLEAGEVLRRLGMEE